MTAITISQLLDRLVQNLQPYLDRGDIRFTGFFNDRPDASYPDGNVTLTGTMESLPFGPDLLDAQELNYTAKTTKYYTGDRKLAQYQVIETLTVPLRALRYCHLYAGWNHSLFNRKHYLPLSYAFPIQARVDGKLQPVAKATIDLILPEETINSLRQQYGTEETDRTIQVQVAGPLLLLGGHATSIGGRNWLEYNLMIFPDQFRIL